MAASILGNTGGWIQQMIGVFGWLDTLSPLLTYLFWYAVIGLFVLLALACARRRHAGALVLLMLVVVFAPVAISYGQAHRLGVIWQGRYIMPMAVGVPLMAVALVERAGALRAVRTRVATVVCSVVACAAFAAFAQALRRYAVGVKGPIDYLRGAWQPPLGATALTVAALVALALSGLFVRHLVGRDSGGDEPDLPQAVGPAPVGGQGERRPEQGKHVWSDPARRRVRAQPERSVSELGL
jgi:hypothetical protein